MLPDRAGRDNLATQMDEQPHKPSLRFKIGVVLLVANVPIGIGGAILAAGVGAATGHRNLGITLGVAIYATSWGMLGLGIVMAGREGLDYVKRLRTRWSGSSRKARASQTDR